MRKQKRKGKIVLVVAVSLDGRITDGKKPGTEWTSREDQEFFRKELDRADAVVMGRKTFQAIKRPLTPRNRIVFSHQQVFARSTECQNVFSGNPAQFLALLRRNKWGRVVVAGGTEVYDWFLEHELANELVLTIEPIILGSGRPFLAVGHARRCGRLLSVKRLNKGGTLLLRYTVQPRSRFIV